MLQLIIGFILGLFTCEALLQSAGPYYRHRTAKLRKAIEAARELEETLKIRSAKITCSECHKPAFKILP